MNNLFLTVLSITIICSFIIVIVILLDKIFNKNYSRKWKYVIWAVIALRLILPINIRVFDIPLPLNFIGTLADTVQTASTDTDSDSYISQSGNKLSNNLTADSKQIITVPPHITDNVTPLDTEDISAIPQEMDQDKSTAAFVSLYSVLPIMTITWIVGAFLFLAYHFLAYFNFKKRLHRWSIPVENDDLLEQFHNLCAELGIKRQINLVTCNQVTSPILIGFIKPGIALPAKNFTMEQYTFILKHELIHYKHHDLYYKIILLCANALHWFNPLIYYMVYLANTDMELYCDEKLIAENNLNYRENYSMTLLQIMSDTTKSNHILLSSGFSSQKKQMKNRFFQIMNAKPTQKGTSLIVSLICLILVAGNLVACSLPPKVSKAENIDKQASEINADTVSDFTHDTIESTMQGNSDLLENTNHILVVGIDETGSKANARADSILVISVNPISKKISLTSFLRDMYVEIPDQGKNKLSAVYALGGVDLIKETIETNLNFTIDHTVTVKMEAFEKIINSIGGVEIELSEEEAKYLNETNYISNKINRTVIPGKQRLNGNQTLGYVRVRYIPTAQGETGDSGRTARLRSVLSSVINECRKKEITESVKLLTSVLSNVSTDLNYGQILTYLNIALQEDAITDMASIPVEGSYTPEVQGGMSVLIPDLEKNVEALKQIFN